MLCPHTDKERLGLGLPQSAEAAGKSVHCGKGKIGVFTVFDNSSLKRMPREASVGREIDFQKLSTSKTYDPRTRKNKIPFRPIAHLRLPILLGNRNLR